MKTIFIVDDEPDVREGMQSWLSEQGYRVVTARDGEEGLKRLNKILPDLILLDITMPKKNGFQFLGDIKRDPRTAQIPVIMLTASPEAASILEAQNLKATDYVTKPFEEKELLRLIRKHDGDYYSCRKSLL
jgi:CheY-like chemotaxis protein